MRRVSLNDTGSAQDNYLFHLSRYKFISRLIQSKDRVLEIGCGTGYGTRFLADYCQEIVGTDTDKEILNQAQGTYQKENLKFVSDFSKYAPLDVIVCLEVIEHLTLDDGKRLLISIKDALGEGGVAFISTPRRKENITENRRKHHLHEYSYEEYRDALSGVFKRALIFSQVDEIISTHHPECAWNYIACCTK